MVQEIIANANSTFETLAQIQAFGENWRKSIGPHLYDELENGEGTNELRVSWFADFVIVCCAVSWVEKFVAEMENGFVEMF